jgi:hypothetical protein
MAVRAFGALVHVVFLFRLPQQLRTYLLYGCTPVVILGRVIA